ncbi:hypothetical protein M1146_08180, partial [Patescibacteria group bacterium]|nr:hypothetical protein [Patescibacteria group bacterium]
VGGRSIRYRSVNMEGGEGRFSRAERWSHALNGVFLRFDTDAPTAGSHRLVEFMNRVLGADLPGTDFPDYSIEDIQKIAWNISRESFNWHGAPAGTISKYPIGENGRPVFPF